MKEKLINTLDISGKDEVKPDMKITQQIIDNEQINLANDVESNESLGFLLKQARQKAGYDLDAIVAKFKISKKNLILLEENKLDQLPNTLFARNVAFSLCDYLKLDKEIVLSKLPKIVNDISVSKDSRSKVQISSFQADSYFSIRNKKFKKSLLALMFLVLFCFVFYNYFVQHINKLMSPALNEATITTQQKDNNLDNSQVQLNFIPLSNFKSSEN